MFGFVPQPNLRAWVKFSLQLTHSQQPIANYSGNKKPAEAGGVAFLNLCNHNKAVKLEFDPGKRERTLVERGLDFARAGEVFAGPRLTMPDARADYGEPRLIPFGLLDGRWVVVVWTPRGAACRIISLRKANEREIAKYAHRVG